MLKTVKTILIPVGLGLGILALIGVFGSALVLFREASAVHPALGWTVAALTLTGFALLVLYPALQLLRLPGALVRPEVSSGPKWEKFLERYARRLLKNRRLQREYAALPRLREALDANDAAALETELDAALKHLDRAAQETIVRHAAAVFTTTAVSQSGRLDTAIVLSAQFRMVKEVAEIYYQRPRFRELSGLYGNVGAAGFIAGEIQDSELLAVLGAPVTAGITAFIPVGKSDPLISLLVNSLLDGSANAFLTLRIGVLARRYCGLKVEPDRRLLARSASLEGAGLLGGVVSQGSSRVAAMTRKLIMGSAARGTTRAAKGVAGLGLSLIGKVFGSGQEGPAAPSPETRYLPESLRFWETIAGEENKAGAEAKRSAASPSAPVAP